MVGNSIYKLNIKCMKSNNNTEQVMEYRDETFLNDLQSNTVNFNIRSKIVALRVF